MTVLPVSNPGSVEMIVPDWTHSFPLPDLNLTILVRIIVLSLISLAVLSGCALAHPPPDVAVTYDQNNGDLVVTIVHQVDDPTTHYIKQVTVTQGNSVLFDTSYSSQPDRSSFSYHYNLPQLKEGNGEIVVNAQCSLFGSRSATLTLSSTPAPGTAERASPAAPAPTKSPVFAGASLAAIALMSRYLRE